MAASGLGQVLQSKEQLGVRGSPFPSRLRHGKKGGSIARTSPRIYFVYEAQHATVGQKAPASRGNAGVRLPKMANSPLR